jgi:phage-related tail protein
MGFLTLGGPDKIGPQMSTVPGHASGTSFAHGGMTLVGEKGPELVNMKRGAQIFDSAQTRRLAPVLGSTNQNQMPAPTSNKNIVVNVTATEKNLGDRIANQVRSVLYAEYLR